MRVGFAIEARLGLGQSAGNADVRCPERWARASQKASGSRRFHEGWIAGGFILDPGVAAPEVLETGLDGWQSGPRAGNPRTSTRPSASAANAGDAAYAWARERPGETWPDADSTTVRWRPRRRAAGRFTQTIWPGWLARAIFVFDGVFHHRGTEARRNSFPRIDADSLAGGLVAHSSLLLAVAGLAGWPTQAFCWL